MDQREEKLRAFVNRTGADHKVARDILQDQNWNVESAIRTYNFLKAAVIPSNAKKNLDPAPNAARQSVGIYPPSTQMAAPSGPQGKLGISQGGVLSSGQGREYSSDPTGKMLRRGMSKTSENIGIINQARNLVLHDIEESPTDHAQHFIDTPEFTFVLPDLTGYPEDFRAFLHKDLIEMSTLVSLEQEGRLNWWADIGACQRLLPLATTGDGNCLLHAASLGMWGFHDRQLTLRTALSNTMVSENGCGALYRRWRANSAQANLQVGLQLSESEWKQEWENLLRLSSTKPRSQPGTKRSCCDSPTTRGMMERNEQESNQEDVFYESLEEFHVFVLAHVLRRPIIVVADVVLRNPSGEALAPILFGGIYLPLECKPSECHRSPLLLTYDFSHFSALVAMEPQNLDSKTSMPAFIPLVDSEFKLLPLHFIHDPGPQVDWKKESCPLKEMSDEQKIALLERYLEVESVDIPLNRRDSDTDSETFQRPESPYENVSRSSSNSSDGKNRESDKEKNKLKGQIDSVAKSFGSIGKSMGKKLKNLSRAVRADNWHKERKASVGSVTQSTKFGTVTADILQDRDHILCAKLLLKRATYQEKMVQNYLHSAKQRFEEDKQLRVRGGEEMRRKVEQRRMSREIPNKPTQCVNQGCNNYGSAETSYLCKSCYDKQRDQELGIQPQSAPHSVAQSAQQVAPPRLAKQTTVVESGKSRFYTYADEPHSLPSNNPSEVVMRSNKPIAGKGHRAQNTQNDRGSIELSRSSFYSDNHPQHPQGPMRSEAVMNNIRMPHPAHQPPPPPYSQHARGRVVTTHSNNDTQLSNPIRLPRVVVDPKVNTLPHRQNAVKMPNRQVVSSYDDLGAYEGAPNRSTVINVRPQPTGGPVSHSQPQLHHAPAHQSHPAPHQQHHAAAPQQPRQSMPQHTVVHVAPSRGHTRDTTRLPCRTIDCPYYGTEETDFLCSSCYKDRHSFVPYKNRQIQM